MMNFAKLNAPDDVGPYGPFKRCWFTLTFDATAAGPSGATITGTTYDPTNHYTTRLDFSNVVNKNLKDLWGITKVYEMVFIDGSSDAQVGGATVKGHCRAEFIDNGNYVKLYSIGCSGSAGTTTGRDEAEFGATASILTAVRLEGYLIGE